MTAKGAMKGVTIDESLMQPGEKEILEDLMVAAVNDARTKAERTARSACASITAGLPIPPGMKLF